MISFEVFFFSVIILCALILTVFFPVWSNISVFFRSQSALWSFVISFFILGGIAGSRILGWGYLDSIFSFFIGFFALYLPIWFLFGTWTLFVFSHKIVKKIYIGLLSIAFGLSGIGIYNFNKDITINTLEITSPKISKEYTFLHITDTQIGSLQKKDIQKISNTIEALKKEYLFDAILFTGDMIDSNAYSLELLEPLSQKDLPVYFSYGNHEFYHDTPRFQSIIDTFGYHTLQNTKTSFSSEVDIIGINDSEFPWHLGQQLNSLDISNDKFSILLYHRPTSVLDAKDAGINLMLVGHTHGGQIFPYTFLIRFLFDDFPVGATTLEEFTLYHSSGVGLWGPKMLLGSENELTIIHLKPESKE